MAVNGNGKQQHRTRADGFGIIVAREIQIVLEHLHGPTLPENDFGRAHLRLMLSYLAPLGRRRMKGFAALWCPWLHGEEQEHCFSMAEHSPRPRFTADELALLLDGVTMELRMALGLTAIGAVDCDRAGRVEAKKARRKLKAIERRQREKEARQLLRDGRPDGYYQGRVGAVRTSLVRWMTPADIAETVAKWKAFHGLTGRSLTRAINRALDVLLASGEIDEEIRPLVGKVRQRWVKRRLRAVVTGGNSDQLATGTSP